MFSAVSALVFMTGFVEVKVLVINYDPIIEKEGRKRLHEVLKWRDPKSLSKGYVEDIKTASGGYVRYRIKEWRDIDEWPKKVGGFAYSDDSFLDAWRTTRKFHEPDGLDYRWMIDSQKVVPLIDSGKIDEIWIFGFPYGGFWEAAMAGPNSYFINGGVYDDVKSKKPFAIMGFSYERGVAEMIHDLCHRAENHLKRAYGSWNSWPLQHNWDKFSAFASTSKGYAGVGNCHFPPNGTKDYDYANKSWVISSAPDWLNYPNLVGKTQFVNRETWGGPDYQRNYLRWWFSHLPKSNGIGPDGREINWWKYIFEFQDYDSLGKRIKK